MDLLCGGLRKRGLHDALSVCISFLLHIGADVFYVGFSFQCAGPPRRGNGEKREKDDSNCHHQIIRVYVLVLSVAFLCTAPDLSADTRERSGFHPSETDGIYGRHNPCFIDIF